MRKVAIIGGGITGLAAGYFLHTRSLAAGVPIDYQIIESSPSFGGKIVSEQVNGFVIEGGPDSFITQKPAALELCKTLNLGDQLIPTNDAARKIYVWSRGQLRLMPEGMMLIVPTKFAPFFKSSLISWRGKLRMGLEAFVPTRRNGDDESLADFVRRRLGAEALDRIAEPLIAGIYVADAEDLSLKSTFPRFLDMEKQHGSLTRAILQIRKTNRKPSTSAMFMTLRGGLRQLVDALIKHLNSEALLANRRALSVAREAEGYRIDLDGGEQLHVDEVVLATPSFVSAEIVKSLDADLSRALSQLQYVSTATVSLGFRRADLPRPLDGFGFVVPRSERRNILACSWSSTKFTGRAPDDHVLVRAFVGGVHAQHLAEQPNETLVQMVRTELQTMMGITATPVLTKSYRWLKANPQYSVGHQSRVAEMQRLAGRHRGLHLAGAAYNGVGIPDCIQDGSRVASDILLQQEKQIA